NDGENEITLYAQWSPLNYSILYYDAEEMINGISQDTYTYSADNDTYITPTEPIKAGYKFIGWCDNYELEGDCEKTIVIPAGTTEDKYYYALWELRCSNNEYFDGSKCVCKNGYELQEMPWSNNYKIDADDYEPYQTAHPDTYIAMRDAMKWRVEWFDNPENREMAGIELSGDAACSLDASVEMVNGVATSGSDVREDLNGQGQYCWCRMTAPAKSKWVYVANLQSGSYDDCKKRCPGYCGGYVSGITVQSNVRKAIYDNVINNEQHMVCLPNDEEIPVENECVNGVWLHVGNDKMCLLDSVSQRPALAIQSGNKTYFLNMSESDLPITNGSTKKMHVLYGGDVYNIHDNSVQ
ncbi:MAG: InlB B-repeat-containing protein, partial [Alphaproteobacteria bacterium]|nr:InlB B-repeat-containing protein [Alphaproteobacteria bacterium]